MPLQTLNDYVRAQAEALGDTIAFKTPLRDWSYRQLDQESNRVAQGLARLGIGAGERVAVLTRQTAECLVLALGANKVGAVCMPVNWRLAAPEIDYIIGNGQARLLLVDREFTAQLPQIPSVKGLPTLVTEGAHGDLPGFADWRAGFEDRDTGLKPDPHDTALQLYSSGTTGLPKGVELTHRNLLANVFGFQGQFGYHGGSDGQPASVQLNALPTFHIAGMAVAMITLVYGGTSINHDAFVPANVLKAIEEHRITHAFIVPAMIQALIMHPDIHTTDLSSLECISYGASPISDAVLVQAMKLMKCRFLQVYGLTETAGAVTCLPSEDHDPDGPRAFLLRSAGRAGGGVKVRIVDTASGQDKAEGEVGEVWIHSEQNMRGYWRNPQATTDVFPEGRANGDPGWFRTGDAGYLRDGYLFIHDRIKDMIISGGENIYPAEVENVLMQHPAIADGAIIGVPDDRWGEAVKACVTLRAGAKATPEEIIAFLRERIAHYKCPKTVDILPELPRNPSGKLLKFQLRKPYWEGRTRAVN